MEFFGLPLATLLSFFLTALIIEVTPGPNMTYLAIVAGTEGRRAGFATVAGVALGLGIIGLIAAFGLSRLIHSSDLLYEGLRWAGVAFLLYLAWEAWVTPAQAEGAAEASLGKYFMRGLITNLLNPKAGLFYVSVLPSFLLPEGAVLPQVLLLTAIYVAVATLIHAGIVLIAGSLEPFLNDPQAERRARRLLAAGLAGVAIWFGVTSAR